MNGKKSRVRNFKFLGLEFLDLWTLEIKFKFYWNWNSAVLTYLNLNEFWRSENNTVTGLIGWYYNRGNVDISSKFLCCLFCRREINLVNRVCCFEFISCFLSCIWKQGVSNFYVGFMFSFICELILFTLSYEESHVDEKTRELKSKEETITQKEKVIKEKSDSVASLQKELSSLQVCVKKKWNKHTLVDTYGRRMHTAVLRTEKRPYVLLSKLYICVP